MTLLCVLFLATAFSEENRIVATTPAHAGWLFEIFKDDPGTIVGVSEHTVLPPHRSEIMTVGNAAKFSAEKIIFLKPTHLIGPLPASSFSSLSRLTGLKHLDLPLNTFPDLQNFLIGLKREFPAHSALLNGYERKIFTALRPGRRFAGKKVALVFAWKPVWLAGPDSYLGHWFQLQNAEVIGNGSWLTLTEEKLLAQHPDILVVLSEAPSGWVSDQGLNFKRRFQKSFPKLEIQSVVCPGLFRLGPGIYETLQCLESAS